LSVRIAFLLIAHISQQRRDATQNGTEEQEKPVEKGKSGNAKYKIQSWKKSERKKSERGVAL